MEQVNFLLFILATRISTVKTFPSFNIRPVFRQFHTSPFRKKYIESIKVYLDVSLSTKARNESRNFGVGRKKNLACFQMTAVGNESSIEKKSGSKTASEVVDTQEMWYDKKYVNDECTAGEEDCFMSSEENDSSEENKNEGAEERYQQIHSSIDEAIRVKNKMKASLMKQLEKAKALEETMKRAKLIVSNLYQLQPGTEEVIVQDWDRDGEEVELVLDMKYGSAQEEADALFASARKMKRGSHVVERLLIETEEALQVLNDCMLDLDDAYNYEDCPDEDRLCFIQDRLNLSASQTGFKMIMGDNKNNKLSRPKAKFNSKSKQTSRTQNTFRKFVSPGGCVVLVGRNRRDNEAICFKISRPTDIWMHARGCPGAHVLIQVRRGSPKPTEGCYQFAANLAAFYSDARTERKAPITTASPRHIQKPRGAPLGTVKLRQEGSTLIGFPSDVDDDLKIARERSGVIWDESGSRSLGGKAKNKKRTNGNIKEASAKRRAEKREKRIRKMVDENSGFW